MTLDRIVTHQNSGAAVGHRVASPPSSFSSLPYFSFARKFISAHRSIDPSMSHNRIVRCSRRRMRGDACLMHAKLFTKRLVDAPSPSRASNKMKKKGGKTFPATKLEPEDPPLSSLDIRLLIFRNAVNTRIICALVLITSPAERRRERLFKLGATNRSSYNLLGNYFRSLYRERR